MDINEVWKHAQPYIMSNINSGVVYNTYLKDAFPISYENSVFTIGVSLPTRKNMIEIKYKSIIEAAITRITAEPVKLKVIISDRKENNSTTEVKETKNNEEPLQEEIKDTNIIRHSSNLNPRYTFENFVVGNSNSYAFAAAENVVNFPAQNNNPLFLYGKSGLGKTHLMQAIGNEVLKRNPDMCVLYVTSEQFMNDMVNCLKEKKMEIFRQRYRDVDMLLVDDVQFIEGRDGTQEEFFHTFNDLHMKNKQIV